MNTYLDQTWIVSGTLRVSAAENPEHEKNVLLRGFMTFYKKTTENHRENIENMDNIKNIRRTHQKHKEEYKNHEMQILG